MQRAKKKTVIITFRNGCNPSLPHFSSDPILFDVPRTATADLAKSNAAKRSHDGSATDEWSAKRVKNKKHEGSQHGEKGGGRGNHMAYKAHQTAHVEVVAFPVVCSPAGF